MNIIIIIERSHDYINVLWGVTKVEFDHDFIAIYMYGQEQEIQTSYQIWPIYCGYKHLQQV